MADNYGDPLNRLMFSGDEMTGFQDSAGEIFAGGDITDESQKMLCFGDFENNCDLALPLQSQISEITCNNNNSSATSSANNGKIKKKRSGYDRDGEGLSSGAGAPAGKRRGGKKNKPENSSGNVHARVKKGKEKLGDRITALQQLVSPFGKTDTASVLHEAMGYIKFLHEQVQVLCSPYLETPLSSSQAHLHEGGNLGENEQGKDLRIRGLCLVPVESTLHVANNNGADLWSPAAAMEKNAASNKY